MPELPEIAILARDMQRELVGRTISGVEVRQPKCLNVPETDFRAALTSGQILGVAPHGKWLQVETTRGWLLLNPGMGGEILLTSRDHLPEKRRLVLDVDVGSALAINFWWLDLQLTKPSLPTCIGHRPPFVPLPQQVSLVHPAPQ